MEIKKTENSFWIGKDEKNPQAFIEFKDLGNRTLAVTSTQVDPSLRGQGVAKILLDRLAEHAREEDLKLKAVCSYVVKKFEEDDSYDDVKLKA